MPYKQFIYEKLLTFLSNNPEVGIGGGAFAFIMGFIDIDTTTTIMDLFITIFQLIGAAGGATLAVLTIYAKFIKKKSKSEVKP